MNNLEINLIASAVTSYIQKKFAFDSVLLPILTSAVLNGLLAASLAVKSFDYNEISWINVYFCIAAILCSYLCYKLRNIIFDKFINNSRRIKTSVYSAPESVAFDTKKYYTIEVQYMPTILCIQKFISLRPAFFKNNVNKKLIIMNNDKYYVYGSPVYFNDTIHNVSGYLTTVYTELTDRANNSITNRLFFTLHIELIDGAENMTCYVAQIEDFIAYQEKYGDVVSLNYYKILNRNIVQHTFFNKSVDEWSANLIELKNEFFSPHRDSLFAIMENKCRAKDIDCWNNLILYGPPGTGKSSFVNRMAIKLKMNIISVNLSLYIDKKKELYAIFHGQEFNLPLQDIKQNVAKNAIIILEEFDQCITKLLQIEKVHQFKEQLLDKFFDNKMHSISKLTELNENANANLDKIPSRSQESKLNEINCDIQQLIKNMSEDNKSEILRIGDLLELFQGPITVKDRIIVATTNHFDKIEHALPALFRAGRLTPLKFSYLDWAALNELCMYYFNNTLSCDEIPIRVATSQLIELAVKHRAIESDFLAFQHELIETIAAKNNETNIAPKQWTQPVYATSLTPEHNEQVNNPPANDSILPAVNHREIESNSVKNNETNNKPNQWTQPVYVASLTPEQVNRAAPVDSSIAAVNHREIESSSAKNNEVDAAPKHWARPIYRPGKTDGLAKAEDYEKSLLNQKWNYNSLKEIEFVENGFSQNI